MWLTRALLTAIFIAFGGAASALRIIVISDLNGSYGSVDYAPEVHRTVQEIIRLAPDVVISTGDMVAGQRRPHLSEAEIRAMWRGFHDAVTEPVEDAGIPFLVTPGNHDASAYDGFQLERRIYRDEWASRVPEGVEGDWPFDYAVKIGSVQFLSLDVTTVGTLPDEQMRWLANQSDDDGPMIAFSHLPLHPFAQGRETEIIGDPKLAQIFERIGVDLHLSGHHHAFYPGTDGAVAYVAQACLGGGSRKLIGHGERSSKGFTIIEIADGKIEVTGHDADGFEVVPLSELPERIGELRRLDLAPTVTVSVGR